MREQRALQCLDSNTLSKRSIPRSALRDRFGRRRSSTSMSKTPKISNRWKTSTSTTKGKPPRTPRQFVTGRNHRRTRPTTKTRDSPDDLRQTSPVSTQPGMEQATVDDIGAKKFCKSSTSGIMAELAGASSNQRECEMKGDDDMELCLDSDSSVDLSSSTPKEAPSSTSRVLCPSVPPVDRGELYFQSIRSNKTAEESIWPLSSSKCSEAGSSLDAGFMDQDLQGHGRSSGQGDNTRLKRLQQVGEFIGQHMDSKADNPLVFDKLLYGDKSLLGTEIGNADWQQESLNGSEITGLTFYDDPLPNKPIVLMPSFPPRRSVGTNCTPLEQKRVTLKPSRSATVEPDNETESHDTIEEWSLPDEEANKTTEFIIDGKKYIHDPLPSGWAVKVSRKHNKPFYIHPDHGITWHCPIILRSRSNARIFRRSKQHDNQDKESQKHKMKEIHRDWDTSTRPSQDAMKARQISFDGSMSQLIKFCNSKVWKIGDPKINDGYEGSESSAFHLSDTDSEINTVVSNLNGSTDTESTWSDLARNTRNEPINGSTPLRKLLFTPDKASAAEDIEDRNSATLQPNYPSCEEVTTQCQYSSNKSLLGIDSEVAQTPHSTAISEDQPRLVLRETPKSTLSIPSCHDEHFQTTSSCDISRSSISPQSSGINSKKGEDAAFSIPDVKFDIISRFQTTRKRTIDSAIMPISKAMNGKTSVPSLHCQTREVGSDQASVSCPMHSGSNPERDGEASPEESMMVDFASTGENDHSSESIHEQVLESNIRNACSGPMARPFGFHVLFPSHPICSLQRLDELLKKKQERRTTTAKMKPRMRQRKKRGAAIREKSIAEHNGS